MLAWFRRTVRSISSNIWLLIFGLVVVGGIILALSRDVDGNDPEIVQLTIDAARTQSGLFVPTLSAQMSRTPADAALTYVAPTLSLAGRQEIRQFAASAYADSEVDNLDRGAIQATGPPNTSECGDFRSAWATADARGVGTLTLLYSQLVTPTSIQIYETFNPGFIVRITITDIYGEDHTVYESEPQLRAQCPFVLIVPILDADYQGNTITVYVDQTNSLGGWNQIDAAELIGIKH